VAFFELISFDGYFLILSVNTKVLKKAGWLSGLAYY